jgi:hypothetical protein
VKAHIFADENRKWWTLGALAFALFMIMLDSKNSDLTSRRLERLSTSRRTCRAA